MKKKKTKSMLILVLLLLSITVGYAILSTNLNINGTSTINKPTWDIHFENIQVKSGSVTPSTAANITNATTVTYAVTLNTPGEFYEFNVDVKNAGTIDGMIESVTSTVNGQPISSLPSYVEYYVTYSDGVEIAPNHLLTAGSKETYTVHIGFSRDIDPEDLPNSTETYNLNFGFTDTQSGNSAFPRPGEYVYTISSEDVHIGSAIPDTVQTYDTYESAKAASGYNSFLAHKIEDGIITASYAGFIYKNNVYYLRGSGSTKGPSGWHQADSPYYYSNKALVQRVFDASKCNQESEKNYMCNDTEEHIMVAFDMFGGVRANHYGFDCYIYDEGSSNCQ